MSVYIHSAKTQKTPAFQPIIRTEHELLVERENFRNSIPDKTNLDLITSFYEIIKSIRDPEHPYTLEQLNVVSLQDIEVVDKGVKKYVTVHWKPSFPTCGYATHIGFAIRIKLEKELMSMDQLKIDLLIKPGGHKQKKIIDKQLNDKERVTAAKENEDLMGLIESLIS